MIRAELAAFSSRLDRARTATARVWVPALPPRDETMGMRMARAITWAMAPWKAPITLEATAAVPRFSTSQGRRERTAPARLASRPTSDTPARARMSSSPSSRMTPTMSSTVNWPTSRPPGSTTGAEIRWYLLKM